MRPPSTLRRSKWPPKYTEVFAWRQKRLTELRQSPELLAGAISYYGRGPRGCVDFINHWVDTYDPRRAGSGRISRVPLVMFERQEDMVHFLLSMIEGEEDGLIEKCRDMGATWICCAVSVWLWRFKPGAAIGWGSRKQDLVDRIGVPDSIFEKIRLILRGLPPEFLPRGFSETEHTPFMRILNPENGASITGEAGDNIGRGGRNLVYFKDESAHYERPEKIEAALGDNTRVQIDISSVNGLGNVFHRRREAGVEWTDGPAIKGRTNVFVMDWQDHPEKDQQWYERRRQKAIDDGLKHVFEQEVNRNYAASVEGIIIPGEWVTSAIGAAERLGLSSSGGWVAGLDVADGGRDKNAFAARKGVTLSRLAFWGERDTGVTTRRAIEHCRELGQVELQYDCVGVGSGVKAEANRLADEDGDLLNGVQFVPWNAGAGVLNPQEHLDPDDKLTPINGDFFGNLKAQGWWSLRRRFEKTHRAITEGIAYPEDELISLDPSLPHLRTLQKELSQPTMARDSRLRMIINKTPEGTNSPNLADAVMMAYYPLVEDTPAVAMFLRRA